MEDPYWRDNEMKALELMKNDFEYKGSFAVDEEELAGADEVILRFNGIDTIADISLNGRPIGSVYNMHRVWEYSVKELLKSDMNDIGIVFHSPVRYIAKQYEKDPAILGTEDAMRGFPKIRKGHFMFGWDWGPRLPDAGIWKEVELLAVKKARITGVYIHQDFNEDMTVAGLRIETKIKLAGNCEELDMSVGYRPDDLRVLLTVTDPDGNSLYKREDITAAGFDGAEAHTISIDSPKLWWPNGLGEQPLYEVTVELEDNEGNVCDDWTRRIGLRRMEVSTTVDEYGSEFTHVVNNVKFFAMGADYIPEDNILSRTGRERTYDLVHQCVAANFNCIRVWGGGLYPSDAFYDACDEMGLVVWEDFMFACANYRLTRDFEEIILAELRDNIRRLRHHASLGLWCGNNEMEMFVLKVMEIAMIKKMKEEMLSHLEDVIVPFWTGLMDEEYGGSRSGIYECGIKVSDRG